MKVVYFRWLPMHGLTVHPGLCLIRTQFQHDTALLAHEAVHADQMREHGTVTFWLRYCTKAYRLQWEAEAYATSARMRPDRFDIYARTLATEYFLGISEQEAADAIRYFMEV